MSAIRRFAIGAHQSPIIAAFNGGGNDGFWRFQWRDRYGRWVKMGRSIKFKLRMPDGSIESVIGKFVGGNKDGSKARILVQGERDIPDGYYHVSSRNGSEVVAHLDKDTLAKRGITLGKNAAGKSVSSRDAKDIQDYDSIGYEPINKGEQHPKDEELHTPDEQPADPNALNTIDSYTDGEPHVSSHFESNMFSDGNSYTHSVDKVDYTDSQEEAMGWFSDTGYEAVSDHFRLGKQLDAEDQALTNEIIGLINGSKAERDVLVYRGISFSDSSPKDKENMDAIFSLKPGDEAMDLGVGSHSTNPDRAAFYAEMNLGNNTLGRAFFRVVIPEGSNAFRIPDHYSSYGNSEKEVILPPKTRYKVNAIHDFNGTRVLDVELLPNEQPKQEESSVPKPSAIPKPAPMAQLPKAKHTEQQKNDDDLKKLQINEPVYNVFNHYEPDLENNDTGVIEIPASPEAEALSKIGRDATPEELAKLKEDSLKVFSTDPNYKPKEKATPKDLESLTKIGGSAFTYVDSSLDINKKLRDQAPNAETMQQVTDLDSAMLLSSHLPPGITVYRMLKLSTWNRLNPQVGKVMIDRAFMSTSHTKAFSDEAKEIDGMSESINQVPMRIVMPTNTSGLDLSSISWYDKEDEYLLPRKTALRFLGWDSNGYAVFERVN